MQALFEWIKAEWGTVVKAPAVFLGTLIFGALIGWVVARTLYAQDLQTMRDYVALVESRPKRAAIGLPNPSSTSVQTPAPINAAELDALKNDNAKLKAENARLKRARPQPRTIGSVPGPSACPSAPIFPNLIKIADCDALLGGQKSVDIADEQRRDFVKTLAPENIKTNAQATELTAEGANISANENQAVANLQSLYNRLCYRVVYASPSPTR